MVKPNPERNIPPTIFRLDFSGRQSGRERDQREAEADRQLRADPEYREVIGRLADGEERRAREHGKNGNRLIMAGLAMAATTVAVDIGVAEVLHMQQFLLGEDVKEWPQRVAHGVMLLVGGIPAVITGSKGLDQWGHQSHELQMARRHREY